MDTWLSADSHNVVVIHNKVRLRDEALVRVEKTVESALSSQDPPVPLRLQLFFCVSVVTFPLPPTLTFRVECLCESICLFVCLFRFGCAGQG